MTRALLVLRPEPGHAATVRRIAARGLRAQSLPLFEVRPLAWSLPDPAGFDALMLTSANAVRHAGPALAALAQLPVMAVGTATAAAAQAAGLSPVLTGDRDGAALAAAARDAGYRRVLRLCGAERTLLDDVHDVPVYVSHPRDIAPGALAAVLAGGAAVALLHSVRAARTFAMLAEREGADRATIRIAAIAPAVAAAAGSHWDRVRIAAAPTDAALIACAATLAIDP